MYKRQVDYVQEAFDIADQYRNPVMVVMDGLIGQMMEPIEWHEVPKRDLAPKDWATTGRKDRDHNNIDVYKRQGLESVRDDIQDSDNNYTRFICIAKDPVIYAGANRISLVLSLIHISTGSR